jgi:hypothetical protein
MCSWLEPCAVAKLAVILFHKLGWPRCGERAAVRSWHANESDTQIAHS